ncbi:sulfatase [Chloroflexi bacterium TSY]|nr:sulfatase [Chloroflexi bacterium TSY]
MNLQGDPMNSPTNSTPPNIIWIFGDQMRAQAMGFTGDPNVYTPNIDRLAAEGLSFTAAVGGCPLCCPYRGSLLSGRYPHNAVPGHEYQLPPEYPTIATAFKENGYHTAYFGKWHVDGFKERTGRAGLHIVPPERRGQFDEWIGDENNNSQWDCWVHGGRGDDAFHYRLPGYETDELTNLLIDYIDRRSNEAIASAQPDTTPFFAVLSVQPPHDPYVAPEEWMRRHTPAELQLRPNVPDIPWLVDQARRDLAGYYGMIENLDWNLGRIRTALDEANLAHNTHIVFFSDHGDMHGSHGQFRKTSPWEESIRVPFIIGGHIPRYANKSGHLPVPINHVDIGPTSLGLCGIDKPDWMVGTDYSGYRLHDREITDEPDSAFLQLVVATGHGYSTDRPWRGIVTRDGWKYAVLEGQPWMLFNLNEDPYEQANCAYNTRFAVERQRLQDRLAGWINDTGDAFELPAI